MAAFVDEFVVGLIAFHRTFACHCPARSAWMANLQKNACNHALMLIWHETSAGLVALLDELLIRQGDDLLHSGVDC